LIVTIWTTLVATAAGTVAEPPTIFVHIENHAVVAPETVRAARSELRRIYDAAGVGVESSVEPDHSRCARQPTVHVLLLAGSMADRYIADLRVGRTVVGQAYRAARRVYVLWERLGVSADRQAVARADALAVVIAHEVGHILMPGRAHSRDGIMHASYDVHLSYGMKFSAEEAAAMRAFITRAQ
jgi:hypothetical protein